MPQGTWWFTRRVTYLRYPWFTRGICVVLSRSGAARGALETLRPVVIRGRLGYSMSVKRSARTVLLLGSGGVPIPVGTEPSELRPR